MTSIESIRLGLLERWVAWHGPRWRVPSFGSAIPARSLDSRLFLVAWIQIDRTRSG